MNSASVEQWLILFYKALENAQEPCKVARTKRFRPVPGRFLYPAIVIGGAKGSRMVQLVCR
jgi:hypothetical protein